MNRNKTTIADRNRKAIAGVAQHYAHTKALVLDGVSFKTTDVEKILQDQIDAADKTAAVRATFHQTVAAETAANAKANALFLALKARVFSDYKTSSEILGDFGLATPQRRKPAAATVVEAARKRKATRAANKPQATVTASAAGQQPAAPAKP
jgi:hypothetical protein